MNAPHPLQAQIAAATRAGFVEGDEETDLREYWDILVDNRWLIAGITALSIAGGSAYAFLSRPVYEANLLIQVEDAVGSARSALGEAASLVEVKTPATAEIEILRSRMIIGQAADKAKIYIGAKPRYVPIVGQWLARRAKTLSNPGFLGIPGYVTGKETIEVAEFTVPEELEETAFRVRLTADGRYALSHPELDHDLLGNVGEPLVQDTSRGKISLLVSHISALPGAEFDIVRHESVRTIEGLQESLKLTERGKQSGVIDARLEGTDRAQLTRVLNEIGRQYVQQNVERRAAEAQKTLAFLDTQLPQFKQQLNEAEGAYNRFRSKQGTVALDEEARLILNRAVDLQAKLLESQQKRKELVSRFTPQHPSVITLDSQISSWSAEISALSEKVHRLPTVQQDALRLERDVKVNNELYQQLRNNALQLQLVREGKIGNVRLIDSAVVASEPVKPRRGAAVLVAGVFGLVGAILLALARNTFFRGIRSPQEIEAHAGLPVYSTVPLSTMQVSLAERVTAKAPGLHVLAHTAPHDVAVESLRSLRTALQFALLDAPNNRILITGATPNVGKSFVSANFAALVASSGKRVLLIDADLRKGYLNSYFGLPRAGGLSELIAGVVAAEQAVHRDVLDHLDLITTGVLPPNPGELLMSGAFVSLLAQFSKTYDLVIIDTPPVLAAADTLGFAGQAGALLLVARAGESQIGELQESAKRLAHAGKTVTGVVFNALDLNRRHYGKYGYKYGGYQYRQYSYQESNVQSI